MNEGGVGDLQEMLFATAPQLDLDIPDFDTVLGRAALDEADTEAFAILTTHIERARDSGDFQRLYQMSMLIGATACLHAHMQEFSRSFDVMQYDDGHGIDDGHGHEDEDDDDEDEDEDAKKQQYRSWTRNASDKKSKLQKRWFSIS